MDLVLVHDPTTIRWDLIKTEVLFLLKERTSGGDCTFESIQAGVNSRDLGLWIALDDNGNYIGLALTQLACTPAGDKFCYLYGVAGKDGFLQSRGDVDKLYSFLVEYGKNQGCSHFRMVTRRSGLERWAECLGWKKTYAVYRKEIN